MNALVSKTEVDTVQQDDLIQFDYPDSKDSTKLVRRFGVVDRLIGNDGFLLHCPRNGELDTGFYKHFKLSKCKNIVKIGD